MSTFATAIAICGLSQSEAATFFDVPLNTVQKWCQNKRTVPPGVWTMLADLFMQILESAEGAADVMDLEGIDPRAFQSIEADLTTESLPGAAMKAAGAMALLMAIADRG